MYFLSFLFIIPALVSGGSKFESSSLSLLSSEEGKTSTIFTFDESSSSVFTSTKSLSKSSFWSQLWTRKYRFGVHANLSKTSNRTTYLVYNHLGKVQIFWEKHKNSKEYSNFLWWYLHCVVFSKYMNFRGENKVNVN